MVVLVHNPQEIKTPTWSGRPELYRVTSGHLALLATDGISDYVVFDRPFGVIDYQDPYVRLLDLEEGIEREVTRDHLNTAVALQILLPAF